MAVQTSVTNMSVLAPNFTNPSTGTSYRLVASDGRSWRVTKSREVGGRLRLAHLRGQVGAAAVDPVAVGRLVAGEGGASATAAVPEDVFATVVLCDLDRTADALTAIAREALAVYERGCPGFRPRSTILRQQRDTTLARAVAECQQMATAWRASGLTTRTPLPVWLNAALSDSDTQRSQSPGAAAPT